jgi:hypothetical protein
MVHIIFKGSGWAGKSSPSSGRRSFSAPRSKEEELHRKIESGQLTDMDIQKIQESGDSSLMRKLTDKENEAIRRKSDVEGKLGITDSKLFDGVDKDGNLFKDIKTGF